MSIFELKNYARLNKFRMNRRAEVLRLKKQLIMLMIYAVIQLYNISKDVCVQGFLALEEKEKR